MLTDRKVSRAMQVGLSSPLDLSCRLGLRPSVEQVLVLNKMRDLAGDAPLDMAGGCHTTPVATGVLWHMLTAPGLQVSVLSSDEVQGADFMGTLKALSVQIDGAIAAVTRWTSERHVEIGIGGTSEPASDCRNVRSVPDWLQKADETSKIFVLLGAGCSETAFAEAAKAAEAAAKGENTYLVRIW